MNTSLENENFSIKFSGPAFDNYEISASMLAQSLLALDNLTRKCAESLYGRDAEIDIKVRGEPRRGSFILDLVVAHPVETISVCAGVATVLTGVISLGKWAFGKKVEKVAEADDGSVKVRNDIGREAVFINSVVHIYNLSRTEIELSRLTQTLDQPGADAITIAGGGQEQIITKDERGYFRHEDGEVLTDSEATMALWIVAPRLDGSPNGWVFSEGEGSREFTARVEDDEFLRNVRENRFIIKNGTTILAIVRTIQKKVKRLVTQKSILEVIDVKEPENK